MSRLIPLIVADDPRIRNRSLDAVCQELSLRDLLMECDALDSFRRSNDNLYQRVRALFFFMPSIDFTFPSAQPTQPLLRFPMPAIPTC